MDLKKLNRKSNKKWHMEIKICYWKWYSLFRCHNNKTAFIEFYQWEKAFQSLLYQCFARAHPQKNKSTNQPLDVYERLREVDNLIKSQQSNNNQWKENEIKLLDYLHFHLNIQMETFKTFKIFQNSSNDSLGWSNKDWKPLSKNLPTKQTLWKKNSQHSYQTLISFVFELKIAPKLFSNKLPLTKF